MSSVIGDTGFDDAYATLGFALKQAQQALRLRLDARLRTIRMTTPQYAVLSFLSVDPGASNAELARRAFVTPQTMQAILTGLARAGLVARTPHPEHGRIQVTDLTDAGRDALSHATAIAAEAERRLVLASAPFDPGEVVALLQRYAMALR